ncbi:hypothetical protein JC881_28560 [Variovorax sp. IB41]|nr:hypothetical protein [Variovorax sp. IB41]
MPFYLNSALQKIKKFLGTMLLVNLQILSGASAATTRPAAGFEEAGCNWAN